MHTVVQSLKQIKLTFALWLTYAYLSGHLFIVTRRKASVIKHRCIISFHTQLILQAGVRAEGRDGRTAAVADFYTLVFTYRQLLFLHTNAIDETALWISELSKFAHN